MDHFAMLHPELAPHAKNIHTVLSALGRTRNWEAKIVHSYRSPEAQETLFRKGRELRGGKWMIANADQIVTHARAAGSAHCALLKGKPAACAVDFALLRDG